VGILKYTPSGTPVCEFTLAVPQVYFGKLSVGYFEIQMHGDFAETHARLLRVGKTVRLNGALWSRVYKDRQGKRVQETRILADAIEEETK